MHDQVHNLHLGSVAGNRIEGAQCCRDVHSEVVLLVEGTPCWEGHHPFLLFSPLVGRSFYHLLRGAGFVQVCLKDLRSFILE